MYRTGKGELPLHVIDYITNNLFCQALSTTFNLFFILPIILYGQRTIQYQA